MRPKRLLFVTHYDLAASPYGDIVLPMLFPAAEGAAGLARALEFVRPGDVLVVWKLDRLGRSLAHLIETVSALEERGVGFRSITEAIDTTTPGGRLVFHLFASLVERMLGPQPGRIPPAGSW